MLEVFFRFSFAFILGACLGSFANVVVIRLHAASSLLGRSHCPACKSTLRPRHLVPILSWLVLGGRCAFCGVRIHYQYPLLELAAALATVVIASRFSPFQGAWVEFMYLTFISIGVMVLMAMDLRWQELPLEGMALLGMWGFVGRLVLFGHGTSLWSGSKIVETLLAVLIAVGFFGLQWLISRGRWLGSGDIWFGAMMGLMLGWPGTPIAIYLAYLVGGGVVLILFLLGYVKRGMRIPFAPALGTGLLLVLWFEPMITNWVSGLLRFS